MHDTHLPQSIHPSIFVHFPALSIAQVVVQACPLLKK